MAQLIENPKNYTGEELSDIFLRPSFTGANAAELGIKVMYGIPQNLTLNFWARQENILKAYTDGWQGGNPSTKYQKTITMTKCKAEQAFSASDYFGMVYEKIVCDGNVNMQDVSGTDIEKAEVALFKSAIAENVRRVMWLGDTAGTVSGNTLFDGFLKKASTYATTARVKMSAAPTKSNIKAALDAVLAKASDTLKSFKSTGKLVFYVTSDVYNAYNEYLDGYTNTVAYRDTQNGRATLNYQGIELVDMHITGLLKTSQSIIMLTHKDNLVFALNTTDMPEAGVRMWYNPDEMQNRQRACFLAGTEILDDSLVVYSSTALAS